MGIVFAGDFLEVLTKSSYVAARHRVVQTPVLDGEPRLSMPFLVRGQPNSVLNTAPFTDEERPEMPLLRTEGLRYTDLRRFLDLKGRKRFCGTQLLPVARDEAATQAAAQGAAAATG